MRLRLAWIAPLALAIMASAGGASASADTTIASVEVYSSAGPAIPRSITLSTLQSDAAQCPPYAQQSITENGYAGQRSVPLGTDAWSVRTVLTCTGGLNLTANAAVVVTGQDGNAEAGPDSVLSGSALDGAVISYAPGNPGPDYDRPWSGQADDYDYADEVTEAPGGIGLAVFNAGPTLNSSISPQGATVAAGTPVTFNAGAAGAHTYSWTFGGGAPASTDATPSETFNTPGTYDVAVVVTDGQGAVGTADTTITVNPASGAPPTSTGPNPQTGNGTTGGTSPTGLVKGGGGSPGTKPGKPHNGSTVPNGHGSGKPATTHHSPGATTKASGGGQPTGRSGTSQRSGTAAAPSTGSSASSGQATARAATTPTQATPTTPAHTPPTPTHPPPPARHPAPRHQATPPPPAQGQIVRGRLISDVVVLPADQSPLVLAAEPAAATPPPVRRGIRSSVVPGLGAALAIVLLLALGAGRELRNGRAAALRARA